MKLNADDAFYRTLSKSHGNILSNQATIITKQNAVASTKNSTLMSLRGLHGASKEGMIEKKKLDLKQCIFRKSILRNISNHGKQ